MMKTIGDIRVEHQIQLEADPTRIVCTSRELEEESLKESLCIESKSSEVWYIVRDNSIIRSGTDT